MVVYSGACSVGCVLLVHFPRVATVTHELPPESLSEAVCDEGPDRRSGGNGSWVSKRGERGVGWGQHATRGSSRGRRSVARVGA